MNESFQNILAVDTATSNLNLAVHFGGDRSVKSQNLIHKSHGQMIIKKIDELLESAGLQPNQLEGLVVSLGPGSFTGLRIGLATVKGMAVALSIPVAGVSLFEIAAYRLRQTEGPGVLLIPSRAGEYYLGAVENGSVDLRTIGVRSADQIKFPASTAWVAGIGVDPIELQTVARGLEATDLQYDAGHLLELGRERLGSSGKVDVASVEPFYLQKAIAEVRFDERERGSQK